MHPCGSSAFGKFKMTADISHLTKAAFMQPGVVTPTTTRFSTGEPDTVTSLRVVRTLTPHMLHAVTYGREYPDSARNPRGFATKFYTGQYGLLLSRRAWAER